MVSLREQELEKIYNKLSEKEIISMDELEQLMYQVWKVLQEIKRVSESRDKWKNDYKKLNDEVSR